MMNPKEVTFMEWVASYEMRSLLDSIADIYLRDLLQKAMYRKKV
jgi:hypothetical protein